MNLAYYSRRIGDVRQHENASRSREAPVPEGEAFPNADNRTAGVMAATGRVDADGRPTSTFEEVEILSITAADIQNPTPGRANQVVRKTAVSCVQVFVQPESGRGIEVRLNAHQSRSPTTIMTATETAASIPQRIPTTSHSRKRPRRRSRWVIDSIRPSYRSRPSGAATP